MEEPKNLQIKPDFEDVKTFPKPDNLRELDSGEVPKLTKEKDEFGNFINEFGCPGEFCPIGYWREPVIDFTDIELNKRLAKKYNMTHMYKTHAFIEGIFIKCIYIWHYNGLPREERNGLMKQTWDLTKENYD